MLWRNPLVAAPRLARAFSGARAFSCSAGVRQHAPPSKAATLLLNDKIADLMTQLEKEDAYFGPISESQRSADVNYGDASHIRPDLDRLRVVPAMMSFYMANPRMEEAFRSLRTLVNKYEDLPQIAESEFEEPAWIDPTVLYGQTQDSLSAEYKQTYYDLLNRLARIEPQLQAPQLQALLYELRDKASTSDSPARGLMSSQAGTVSSLLRRSLDQFGRSLTGGGRKTASASVYMARAHENQPGQIVVNGRSLEQYFPAVLQRHELLYPLRVVNGFTKFNIAAKVQGGGQAAQAAAVALAIAKGLCIHNPLLVNRLQEAGCLYRDPRKKERKKPGLAKARKAYTWVKR